MHSPAVIFIRGGNEVVSGARSVAEPDIQIDLPASPTPRPRRGPARESPDERIPSRRPRALCLAVAAAAAPAPRPAPRAPQRLRLARPPARAPGPAPRPRPLPFLSPRLCLRLPTPFGSLGRLSLRQQRPHPAGCRGPHRPRDARLGQKLVAVRTPPSHLASFLLPFPSPSAPPSSSSPSPRRRTCC